MTVDVGSFPSNCINMHNNSKRDISHLNSSHNSRKKQIAWGFIEKEEPRDPFSVFHKTKKSLPNNSHYKCDLNEQINYNTDNSKDNRINQLNKIKMQLMCISGHYDKVLSDYDPTMNFLKYRESYIQLIKNPLYNNYMQYLRPDKGKLVFISDLKKTNMIIDPVTDKILYVVECVLTDIQLNSMGIFMVHNHISKVLIDADGKTVRDYNNHSADLNIGCEYQPIYILQQPEMLDIQQFWDKYATILVKVGETYSYDNLITYIDKVIIQITYEIADVIK
jgi:hypothetical protein